MEALIRDKLSELEAREDVKIFYAVESGSRAWGFPSLDSDYDVRFLYLRPMEWYLSIEEKRDVIEVPINDQLDINGWDLKKALRLLRATNTPLLEWLGSPIVYREKLDITAQMRVMAAAYFSPRACIYRYHHMARANYDKHLTGDTVTAKKYLYTLRPLLAIRWIEQGHGIAPTEFNRLVERMVLDTALQQEIEQLVAVKQQGAERDHGKRKARIDAFIERELARLAQGLDLPTKSAPLDELDQLFQAALAQAWVQ